MNLFGENDIDPLNYSKTNPDMTTTIIDYTLVPKFSALRATESSAQLLEVSYIWSTPTPKSGFWSKNDFAISLPNSQTQPITAWSRLVLLVIDRCCLYYITMGILLEEHEYSAWENIEMQKVRIGFRSFNWVQSRLYAFRLAAAQGFFKLRANRIVCCGERPIDASR